MDTIANVGAAMLRLSAPLILAAMAGALSYQVGLINIALEGLMLFGAFAAVDTSSGTVYVGNNDDGTFSLLPDGKW